MHLPALLATHFGISRSEGRRLIAQGGVRIDGETVAAERARDPGARELDGRVMQVGKRRYKRLRAGMSALPAGAGGAILLGPSGAGSVLPRASAAASPAAKASAVFEN